MSSSYMAPNLHVGSSAATSTAAAALATSLAVKASISQDDDGDGLFVPSASSAESMLTATTVTRSLSSRCHVFFPLAALASMLTSLCAMYVEKTLLIYIAFGIPLVGTAPMVLYQYCRYGNSHGTASWWRWAIRDTRHQVSRLATWNQLYHEELTRLQQEQARLQHVQHEFQSQVQATGGDWNEMQQVVREYGHIQKEMKRLTAAQELQQLMSVMLNTASSKSKSHSTYQFTEKDIDQIMVRLQNFSMVDRHRLRQVFQTASSKSFQRLYQAAAHDLLDPKESSRHLTREADVEQGNCQPTEAATSTCHDDTTAFDFWQWKD